MTDKITDEVVFNGVNASEKSNNRGKYLLTLTPDELRRIALGHTYPPEHWQELKERNRSQHDQVFALEFGRDENNLAEAGWGVIFPARADNGPIEAIRDALKPLLNRRKQQAGGAAPNGLYKEFIGPNGYLPKDTADRFMSRHGGSPGTVDPTKLPYYLLIVGGVDEIPYRFQYELDVTYLVGRIAFDTLDEYAQYAQSVVRAEEDGLRLPRRSVFFGPAHIGDRATQLSAQLLVTPLADHLRTTKADWQVELVAPADSRKARLEALLGKGDAPALLFTASHGVGFDNGDPAQLPFQGALLCQDLETISADISRQHYLGAEDIADDFRLHGLISFHFACFGAGTPQRDSFTRPDRQKPQEIAPRDFLAALPRRLLSHPKGGALAVVGHVDRAWTYSFQWGDAGRQTQTFQDTLLRLTSGQRIGVALDQLNIRYSQIAARLTGMLDIAEVVRPDISDLAGLWTANNDARGYALLGDPAVMLPVAKGQEQPTARQELAPVAVTPAAVTPAVIAPAAPTAASPDTGSPTSAAGSTGAFTTAVADGSLRDAELRRTLRTSLKALAAQLDSVANQVDGGAAPASFDAEAFGLRETLSGLGEKLDETMRDIADRLKEFANDMTSLEVRTYISDRIEEEDFQNGSFTGGARQRALTHISLDGDTRLVIPADASGIDDVVWEIHARAVKQAQDNRAAMLKAVGELLTGLVSPGK